MNSVDKLAEVIPETTGGNWVINYHHEIFTNKRALLHESKRYTIPIRAPLSDLDGNRHTLGCHCV